MKKLLSLILVTICLVSCQPRPVYVVQPIQTNQIIDPNQQYDQVPVTYNGVTFFVDYLVYRNLYTHGGNAYIYSYYNSHRYDTHFATTRHYYSRTYQSHVNNYNHTTIVNRSSLSRPTTSQRSFSTTRISPVRSGGFGNRSSSPSRSSFGSSRSSGFGRRR